MSLYIDFYDSTAYSLVMSKFHEHFSRENQVHICYQIDSQDLWLKEGLEAYNLSYKFIFR